MGTGADKIYRKILVKAVRLGLCLLLSGHEDLRQDLTDLSLLFPGFSRYWNDAPGFAAVEVTSRILGKRSPPAEFLFIEPDIYIGGWFPKVSQPYSNEDYFNGGEYKKLMEVTSDAFHKKDSKENINDKNASLESLRETTSKIRGRRNTRG